MTLLEQINSLTDYDNIRKSKEILRTLASNSGGSVQTGIFIYQQTPVGLINGVNATFQIPNALVVDTEQIYVNGQRQKKPQDYNISGQVINFAFSPNVQETILIDYIKQ